MKVQQPSGLFAGMVVADWSNRHRSVISVSQLCVFFKVTLPDLDIIKSDTMSQLLVTDVSIAILD